MHRSARLPASWFVFALAIGCGGAEEPTAEPDAEPDAADSPVPDVSVDTAEEVEACAEPCSAGCCPEKKHCDPFEGTCVDCLNSGQCAKGLYCHPQSHACATAIRIATYNILGSHFTDAGSPICLGETGAACAALRAVNTMKVIRGEAGFAAFDVVGVQEMERDQFIQIGQGLSGVDPKYKDEKLKYDRHPVVVDADYLTKNIDDYQRTIYWRRDLFAKVTSGRITYPTNDGTNIGVSRPSYAPWVQLRILATGETFFVLNHHAAVTTQNKYRSPSSALFREQTAKIVSAWAASVQKEQHRPVVILGDFNSTFVLRTTPPVDDDAAYKGDRSRLPYCVMTASGVLRNAEDAAAGKTGMCPTLTGSAVDHLYVTNDLHVEALVRTHRLDPTKSPASDALSHASDHSPVYADLGLLVP